ncbi:hypothetical protein AJ80_08960 [Polytolypa hystricis UAMH7299]|uniref:Uncharacterized protein n=1 Tax=Polytolypa hystricis (strain UAMH7299) TaxID=1447883 RepID=A0A2B7WQZ3_POLH7|nr:hypothetical protein AJ80_08960 [Polytolypa hystricis UAMH7299]
MGKFSFWSLALLSVQALLARAEDADNSGGGTEEQSQIPGLSVSVSASFPSSEIFGVKLVNGHPTEALLSFVNEEPDEVTVSLIGGSLWSDIPGEPTQNVRNLTTTQYQVNIPAGGKESLPYAFATEMHPQDLRLHIAAIVGNKDGVFFTLPAYNGTVSIVEPDTSIFDPQIIFLYVFLLSCSVGVMYTFYNLWIAPYFPQKRKATKGGDRTKKSSSETKAVDASEQGAGSGSDGPSAAKTFDTEWIPAHHINRPEARKVKGKARNRA